jgi:tetratricopeptide (TPR) repeat protein
MESRKQSRRRAVVLTPEGLAALQEATHRVADTRGLSGRMSRKERARLYDVSVTTLCKIEKLQRVDRQSLIVAFKNVNEPWREDYIRSADSAAHWEHEERAEHVERIQQAPIPEAAPALAETPEGVDRLQEVATSAATAGTAGWFRSVYAAAALFLLAIALLGTRAILKSHAEEGLRRQHSALMHEGITAYYAAEYAQADAHLTDALAVARRIGEARKLSDTLHRLGDLLVVRGDLEEACARYAEALTIIDAMGMFTRRAPILESYGNALLRMSKPAEAEQRLLQSLQAYEADGNQIGTAMAYRGLGSVSAHVGDFERAERFFNDALAALDGLDESDLRMDIRGRIALIESGRGNPARAREILGDCLEYWEERGHPRWLALTKMRIGQIELREGNRGAATALLVDARSLYKSVADSLGVRECDDLLSDLLASRS